MSETPYSRVIGVPGGITYDESEPVKTTLSNINIRTGANSYSEYSNQPPNIQNNNIHETGFMPSQYKACARISSRCRSQKALFLLHAVGSGKTITSLCMAFNTNPSIQTTIITIRGLETVFRDEHKNLLAIYDKQLVDSKFNEMHCVFYDELASKLLSLALLSVEEREKEILKHYKNKFLIFDEAHKILAILAKDPTGASERMLKFIFSSCVKVIFMSATPLQRDWSDFGKLMKLIAQINDPDILTQIRVWDERVFKKNFWFPHDLDANWKNKDNLYTVLFIKLVEWSDFLVVYKQNIDGKLAIASGVKTAGGGALEWIKSPFQIVGQYAGNTFEYLRTLGYAGKLVGGSLLVVALSASALGSGIMIGTSSILALATGAALKVGSVGITLATISLWTKTTLLATKSIIDIFSVAVEPLDIEQVALLFYPHISFNDYKATEKDHMNVLTKLKAYKEENNSKFNILNLFKRGAGQFATEETSITNYETILSRFPVLNIHIIDVKMEWHQVSMLFFNLNKGYVPTSYDLYSVARISADLSEDSTGLNFRYLDSTQINQEDVSVLQIALRSVGNFSIDCAEYLPVLYSGSDILFKNTYTAYKLSEKLLCQYHGKETYYSDIKPRLEKINQTKSLENAKLEAAGLKSKYPVFSCNKFNKALEIITEARKKYIYLPVVYSNFLDQGLKRFSAFLTNQNLPHLILGPSTLAENPDFIEQTQNAYIRWICSPEMISSLVDPDISKLNTYATYKQPCCILIDPSLQEGLSLVLNEVMICMEPMAGYGNQEQVYGRIVRSYSDNHKILNIRNYELHNDTYNPESGKRSSEITITSSNTIRCRGVSKSDDSKILAGKLSTLYTNFKAHTYLIRDEVFSGSDINVIYSKYAAAISLYKNKLFRNNSQYEGVIYKDEHLNSRPIKHCFQLISKIRDEPKEEEILKIPIKELFTKFCEKLGEKAKFQIIIDKLPVTIATPLFILEKAIETEVPANLKDPWLIFLQKLVPMTLPCVDWEMFFPLSMVYSSYIEIESLGSQIVTNPQKWSEIAKTGAIVTSIAPTSDQYWFSKIKIQEIEFNRLREQFNKTTDDQIHKLYPDATYIKERRHREDHFQYDRYKCEESDRYYPLATHKKGYRCSVKAKRKGSWTNSCDKIGPAALVGGRLTRKRGGNGQLQMLLPRPVVEKDSLIGRLENIYNSPAKCLQLCQQNDNKEFVLKILEQFNGKSEKESINIARDIIQRSIIENDELIRKNTPVFSKYGVGINIPPRNNCNSVL